MKKVIKRAWLHLKAETPKFWNWVAGVSTSVPLLVSAVNIATANTVVPEWYTGNQFYILGGATALAFFAKSRTTEKGKEEVTKKLEA